MTMSGVEEEEENVEDAIDGPLTFTPEHNSGMFNTNSVDLEIFLKVDFESGRGRG